MNKETATGIKATDLHENDCGVAGGMPHAYWMCCSTCNVDRHLCRGCGEWVGHGRSVCAACSGSGEQQ